MVSGKIQFNKFVKGYLERFLKNNRNNILKKYHKDLTLYLQEEIYKEAFECLLMLMRGMKEENFLEGTNKEERYDFFDTYSGTDDFFVLLSSLFPILIERLDNKLEGIIKNYEIFIKNFENDFNILKEHYNWNEPDINNCNIKFGISDYHQNYQEVYIINDGTNYIVYKPRSGNNELYWNHILEWVNKYSEIKLPKINVYSQEQYQWQEFINSKSCELEEDIRVLYYKIGMLACLSYILNVTDLHLENIMVNGNKPYIIDLETLLQVKEDYSITTSTDELKNKIQDSVLSTHLLPTTSTYLQTDVDLSGITGFKGQIIKNGNKKIKDPFTDEMSLIKTDFIIKPKNNIGKLQGEEVNPKDYSNEMISGFSYLYNTILENSNEFLDIISDTDQLKDVKIRYIFRDTEMYGNLLEISRKPKYLSCKEELIDLLKAVEEIEIENNCEKVYRAEISNLYNGNIPYFYMRPFNNNVYGDNDSLCYKLKSYPIDGVRKRIFHINEQDKKFQCDLIKYSLLHFEKPWRNRKDLSYKDFSENNKKIDKKFILEEAKNIADFIINKSVLNRYTNTVNWMDISNAYPNWYIGSQDIGVYSGLSGNAIFFLMLYITTRAIKYKNFLEKILTTIELDLLKEDIEVGSAFNGKISVVYLYLMLYKHNFGWNYLDKAIDIIASTKEDILSNKEIDIIDGKSGVLLIVLNLHKLTGDRLWKTLAVTIGDSIINSIEFENNNSLYKKDDKIEILVDGFAHGIAGIAYAIGELYKITYKERYLNLIIKLNNINSKNYDDKLKNWFDLRVYDNEHLESAPIHWCHGAAGIGLMKIRLMDILDTNKDLSKAYNTVINKGLNLNCDSLCHGNFGNMDFIIEYNKMFRINDIEILNLAKNIIRCRNSSYINGVARDFESVNFMLGLSGIAYELLRLYNNNLPSVLLLEI